jgi:histidinol-phosphate aminotransferase
MGGRAVVPTPTYSMYAVLTSQRQATAQPVPRRGPEDGFALDLDALLPALDGCQLVWLCAPNNPTGAPEAPDTVERLLEAAHALGPDGPGVVVDEAYIEFHPTSVVGLRHRYPRLIVVRTVSKAFALAGMRVGYAVAARPTIERLERFRPPGSVATVSARVAAVALRRPELAAANAAALAREREWLAEHLREIGLPPYPSVTNFLLCAMGGPDEAWSANEHLLRNGIVTRTFAPDGPLSDHLRFTVRTREQDERLLEVLAGWLAGRRA